MTENHDTVADRVRHALVDVEELLAEHEMLRDSLARIEALAEMRLEQLAERSAEADRLAERLAELSLIHSPCPIRTPVHGSSCIAGFSGHTGAHRTIGGWTWT